MRKERLLLARVFITGISFAILSGCQDASEIKPVYGHPTHIGESADPLQALCNIQKSFVALAKPVQASKTYLPGWTSTNLGAAPVKHKGFYQFHLHEQSLRFISQHARLELVAALVPVFAKPNHGGEAATLLAGIPAGAPSTQGTTTATLANTLEQLAYRSVGKPGRWFTESQKTYSKAASLYGLQNSTESIHQQRPEGFSATLEARIIEVLKAHSHLPLNLLTSQPRMPQPHNEKTIAAWIAQNDAPELVDQAKGFIQQYPKMFTAMVLFPLLPEPGRHLNRNEILMMYLLDMQNEYWPALLHLSSGQTQINVLRKKLQHSVQQIVSNSCS